MSIKDNLISLIDKKKAKIGVVGLGYVGLPLVKHLCNQKFKVIGFDDKCIPIPVTLKVSGPKTNIVV